MDTDSKFETKLSLPKIKNTILKTDIGSFAAPTNTPIKSYKDRLCLTASEFKNILINTVDNAPKLPPLKNTDTSHIAIDNNVQRTFIQKQKFYDSWYILMGYWAHK